MRNAIFAALSFVSATSYCRCALWFQLTPPCGTYYGGASFRFPDAPKDARIVFDVASARQIVHDITCAKSSGIFPGLIVDEEHSTLKPDGSTRAMAWITDARVEGNGSVWAKFEFTEAGWKAWSGRELVSRSPVLSVTKAGDGLYRPTGICSVAMTNKPRLPVKLEPKEK